jgi:hypothetical protein
MNTRIENAAAQCDQQKPADEAGNVYSAILIGGPFGIGARIIGSIPRKFTRKEVRVLRTVLNAGYCIEVVMPSKDVWDAQKDLIYRQIGLRGAA